MFALLLILILFILGVRHFAARWGFPYSDPCGLIMLARIIQEKGICALNYIRPLAAESNFSGERLEYLEDKTYFLYPFLLSRYPSRDPIILNRIGVRVSTISALLFCSIWLFILNSLLHTGFLSLLDASLIYAALILHPGIVQLSVNTRTDMPYLLIVAIHVAVCTFEGFGAPLWIVSLFLGASGCFAYLLRTHAFVLVFTDLALFLIMIFFGQWPASSLVYFIIGGAIPLAFFPRATVDAVVFYWNYFFAHRGKEKKATLSTSPADRTKSFSENMLLNVALHALQGVFDFFNVLQPKRSIIGLVGLFGLLAPAMIVHPTTWIPNSSAVSNLLLFSAIYFIMQTASLLLVSLIVPMSQFAGRENIPIIPASLILSYALAASYNLPLLWVVYYLGFVFLLLLYICVYLDLSLSSLTHHFSFWNMRFEDSGVIRTEQYFTQDKETHWWCSRAKDISWRDPNKLFLRGSSMYIWDKRALQDALAQYDITRMHIEEYNIHFREHGDPDKIFYRLYHKLPVNLDRFQFILLKEFADGAKRTLIYAVEKKV